MDNTTCAKCGKEKELCRSGQINGIKQPRICKDCLIESMKTGDYTKKNTNKWFNKACRLQNKNGALQNENKRLRGELERLQAVVSPEDHVLIEQALEGE